MILLEEEFLEPKYKVIYNGEKYRTIGEFDCLTIKLIDQKNSMCSSFMTQIPISGKLFRLENPTKARAVIEHGEHWTNFFIFSDWGDEYHVAIHNSLNCEIKTAIASAIENDLLK